MKKEKNESSFPIQAKENFQDIEALEGHRKYEDITEKEKKHLARLYKFTPDEQLKVKFRLDTTTFERLVREMRDEGYDMEKDEMYSRSVVAVQKQKMVGGQPQTRAHLLNSFMDTVPEEQRREFLNMYEEGIEPIPIMKQLIAMQGVRLIRGGQLERNSTTQLHKTLNDAFEIMVNSVAKLQDMEEGQKIVHGIDDSFVGLILANQKRKQESGVPDDYIDIEPEN